MVSILLPDRPLALAHHRVPLRRRYDAGRAEALGITLGLLNPPSARAPAADPGSTGTFYLRINCRVGEPGPLADDLPRWVALLTQVVACERSFSHHPLCSVTPPGSNQAEVSSFRARSTVTDSGLEYDEWLEDVSGECVVVITAPETREVLVRQTVAAIVKVSLRSAFESRPGPSRSLLSCS